MSDERWAAPEPARVPSGAEAGHEAPSGRLVPAEGLRPMPQRGLQDRPPYPVAEGLK